MILTSTNFQKNLKNINFLIEINLFNKIYENMHS